MLLVPKVMWHPTLHKDDKNPPMLKPMPDDGWHFPKYKKIKRIHTYNADSYHRGDVKLGEHGIGSVHTYIHYVCMYVCNMHACIHIYIHAYMHAYIHTCMHTNTHAMV